MIRIRTLHYVTTALTCLLSMCVAVADRPILLVTPQGIFQADVTNGVPENWRPIEMDVIVRGFDTPKPGPTPPPPVDDAIVQQVSSISKATLKDKNEAIAVAAIVNSLNGMGLTGANFKQALEMSIPIADSSLSANGRLVSWSKQVLAVTSDAVKIKAGVQQAFDIPQSTLSAISTSAANPEQAVVEEALDFTMIITIIQAIIALLKQLGII